MFEQQSIFKLDGYTVIRELAEGSFGEICEVLEIETQKVYALKALLKSHLMKTDTLREARLEGLLLEILDHPGIVKLHEIKEDQDYLFLIMQLGARGDLKDLLSKTTTKEQWKPETKKLLAQILDTVSYLHSHGILHCDIKPENIVVMNKGNPKLVDFGTARIFDRDLVTAEILERWDNFAAEEKTTGSAEFISPEGIKGEATPARDIWAFGVLAYWVFHGKLPFTGSSHLQIFERIRDSEPHIQQTLGQSAKQLIRECLKKDPSERPSAAHIKHFEYFQDINFKQLFTEKAKLKQKCLVQYDVQKRMFFGNYKARVLKVTIQSNQLFLSYCYPQTGAVKRKIKLEPSDFADFQDPSREEEFFVRTREDKLYFRTQSGVSTKNCVNEVNQAIKKFYQL